jgi:hypothetical protein
MNHPEDHDGSEARSFSPPCVQLLTPSKPHTKQDARLLRRYGKLPAREDLLSHQLEVCLRYVPLYEHKLTQLVRSDASTLTRVTLLCRMRIEYQT